MGSARSTFRRLARALRKTRFGPDRSRTMTRCSGGMASEMSGNSIHTTRLLQQALEGEVEGFGTLLAEHRERLRRMVSLRLDRRLQGRIDPSDVIQETYMEASTRLPDYVRAPSMPFFLWLRFLASQKLATLHRHHLGAQMRDAGLEVGLGHFTLFEVAAGPADRLPAEDTRPSEAAMRAERKSRMHEALDSMDPLDREVLVLRHFEQLSRAEIAHVFGVSEAAAAKQIPSSPGTAQEDSRPKDRWGGRAT